MISVSAMSLNYYTTTWDQIRFLPITSIILNVE